MAPAALNSTLAAYVAQARKDGVIDDKTANYFESGFGNATPMQSATTITTTGMNNATDLAKQRMVTGEQGREFDLGNVLTTDQPGGAPINTARKDSYGKPAFDANYNTGFHREVLTQPTPGGPVKYGEAGTTAPGTPVYSSTHEAERGKIVETAGPQGQKTLTRGTDLVSGTQGYTPRSEELGTTPVLVIDPANNNSLKTVSAADFAKGNYVRAPGNIPPDQVALAQDSLDHGMARRFQPPPVPFQNQAYLSPARASGTDNARLVALETQLYQTSPDSSVRGNWQGAADAAITQAQQENWLPTEEEAAQDRQGFVGTKVVDRSRIFQTQDAQGKGTNTYYLLPKKSLGTAVTSGTATTQGTPAPTGNGPGFLGSLFGNPYKSGVGAAPAPTPAPTSTAIPSGAVAAMPGYPDGAVVTGSNGTKVVVRGGYGYPAQTSGAPTPDQGR